MGVLGYLAAVAFLVTWLVRAQDLLWPMLVAQDPNHRPGPLHLVERASRVVYLRRAGLEQRLPVGIALPAVAFVALLLIASHSAPTPTRTDAGG